MSNEIHIPVTVREEKQLKQLDIAWDSISTVIGLYSYFRILGIARTRIILKALGEKKKVHIHVIKIMLCSKCGAENKIAPIKTGEVVAVGKDPSYLCSLCKTLETLCQK